MIIVVLTIVCMIIMLTPKPDNDILYQPLFLTNDIDIDTFILIQGEWNKGDTKFNIKGDQVFQNENLVYTITMTTDGFYMFNSIDSTFYSKLVNTYMECYMEIFNTNIVSFYLTRPNDIKAAPILSNKSVWQNSFDKDFVNAGIINGNNYLTLLPDADSNSTRILWTLTSGEGPFFQFKSQSELLSYNIIYKPLEEQMILYHTIDNNYAGMILSRIENPLNNIQGQWTRRSITYNIIDYKILNQGSLSYNVYRIFDKPPSPGSYVMKHGYYMYMWHDSRDKNSHVDDKTVYYGINDKDEEVLYKFLWKNNIKSGDEIFER